MKLPRRHFLHLAAGAAALPFAAHVARAQAYPERPSRWIVPYPPINSETVLTGMEGLISKTIGSRTEAY